MSIFRNVFDLGEFGEPIIWSKRARVWLSSMNIDFRWSSIPTCRNTLRAPWVSYQVIPWYQVKYIKYVTYHEFNFQVKYLVEKSNFLTWSISTDSNSVSSNSTKIHVELLTYPNIKLYRLSRDQIDTYKYINIDKYIESSL